MSTLKEPDLAGFWAWFAERESEILEIVTGKRAGRVTEMIDRALEAHGLDLTYEVTEGSAGGELTFTPEGDPELGRFLDRFVAAAPSLSSWLIFSRVQRKPFPTALAFVKALYGIDISDAHFKVAYVADRYHLCFLHDGLAALDEDRRFLVASTLLDHALGEALVMESIGQLEFKPSAEGVAMSLLINEIILEA
jgi:hypothetical protein